MVAPAQPFPKPTPPPPTRLEAGQPVIEVLPPEFWPLRLVLPNGDIVTIRRHDVVEGITLVEVNLVKRPSKHVKAR